MSEWISAREAARNGSPLDGADAQALEGALQLTEAECESLVVLIGKMKEYLVDLASDSPPSDSCPINQLLEEAEAAKANVERRKRRREEYRARRKNA